MKLAALVLITALLSWVGWNLGDRLAAPDRSESHRDPVLPKKLDLTRAPVATNATASTRYANQLAFEATTDEALRDRFIELAKADAKQKRLDNDEIRRVMGELILRDPESLVALVQDHFRGLKREHAYFRLIEDWGYYDPEATLQFLAELDEEDDSSNILNATTGMLSQWAMRDARGALEAWTALPNPKLPWPAAASYGAECLCQSAAESPGLRSMALEMLLSETPSSTRSAALSGVLKQWARQESLVPVADWLDQQNFDAKEAAEIALGVAAAAVERESVSAAQWMTSRIADPELRAEAMGDLADQWTMEDPRACTRWLQTLTPSNETDYAIEGYLRRASHADPEAGLHWARKLQHPARQKKRVRELWTAWHRHAPDAALSFVQNLTANEQSWLNLSQ